MGIFSGKTTVSTYTSVNNLGGDEIEEYSFLNATILGAIMSDSDIVPTMNSAYMNGAGVSLKIFANWAKSSGFNDAINLHIDVNNRSIRVGQSAVAEQVATGEFPIAIFEEINIGPADMAYWVRQYLLENDPEGVKKEFSYEYNILTNTVTVYLEPVWASNDPNDFTYSSSFTFSPINYDPLGMYIYAMYYGMNTTQTSNTTETDWTEVNTIAEVPTVGFTVAKNDYEVLTIPIENWEWVYPVGQPGLKVKIPLPPSSITTSVPVTHYIDSLVEDPITYSTTRRQRIVTEVPQLMDTSNGAYTDQFNMVHEMWYQVLNGFSKYKYKTKTIVLNKTNTSSYKLFIYKKGTGVESLEKIFNRCGVITGIGEGSHGELDNSYLNDYCNLESNLNQWKITNLVLGNSNDYCDLSSNLNNWLLREIPIYLINDYCTLNSNLNNWILKDLPQSNSNDYCALTSNLNNWVFKDLFSINNLDYCTLGSKLNDFYLENV